MTVGAVNFIQTCFLLYVTVLHIIGGPGQLFFIRLETKTAAFPRYSRQKLCETNYFDIDTGKKPRVFAEVWKMAAKKLYLRSKDDMSLSQNDT
jgi:hypothetical protein